MSKLKQLVSMSKEIISALEFENKNLLDQIENLKERQSILTQISSTSRSNR